MIEALSKVLAASCSHQARLVETDWRKKTFQAFTSFVKDESVSDLYEDLAPLPPPDFETYYATRAYTTALPAVSPRNPAAPAPRSSVLGDVL
jgi:hypothetical protein